MSDAPEILQAAFAQPEPEKPKRDPIKLSEMMWMVNDEAERIENVQLARAKMGEQPNAEMMRRAEIFRALGHFLFLIEPKLDAVKRIITAQPNRGGKR
jgi:hypothetical protein